MLTKKFELVEIELRRASKTLKAMKDEPVIIEMNDGDVIAGRIDGCEDVSVCLYDAHRLAEDKSGWILYDELIASGKDANQVLIADSLPVFEIAEIKRILRVPDSELDPKLLQLEDVMNCYLNPDCAVRPVQGIKCDWEAGGNNSHHSAECEIELHEALATVWMNLTRNCNNRKKYDHMMRALMTLRKHLLLRAQKSHEWPHKGLGLWELLSTKS